MDCANQLHACECAFDICPRSLNLHRTVSYVWWFLGSWWAFWLVRRLWALSLWRPWSNLCRLSLSSWRSCSSGWCECDAPMSPRFVCLLSGRTKYIMQQQQKNKKFSFLLKCKLQILATHLIKLELPFFYSILSNIPSLSKRKTNRK